MGSFGPGEMLFIAVFALLIFGPKRLPEIARSMGKALREFRKATSGLTEELKAGLDDHPNIAATRDEPEQLKPGPKPRRRSK